MCIVAVHYFEIINHRHIRELVYKIVVVVMACGILIYETTFFQLWTFVVVPVSSGLVVVADQHAFMGLRFLKLVVVQQ